TGCSPSVLSPSMVVTLLPCAVRIGVWHERTARPSTCTVHAPHRPAPQPKRVPVSRRSSRRYHNSGMSSSPSNDRDVPLTLKLTIDVSSQANLKVRLYESRARVASSEPSLYRTGYSTR